MGVTTVPRALVRFKSLPCGHWKLAAEGKVVTLAFTLLVYVKFACVRLIFRSAGYQHSCSASSGSWQRAPKKGSCSPV